MDPLERLQRWYLAQCDGEWEHVYGVEVGTLDNPGWTVKIDLTDTALSAVPFDRLEAHYTDDDWVVCRVEGYSFHAACGPLNLEEALEVFLDWAAG